MLLSLTEGPQLLLLVMAIPRSALKLGVYSADSTYHQHTKEGQAFALLLGCLVNEKKVITKVGLSNPTMHVNSLTDISCWVLYQHLNDLKGNLGAPLL